MSDHEREPWYPRNPDAFEGVVTVVIVVVVVLALIAFITSGM